MKKLYRRPEDGMLCGVCAGIGEYFGWDASWVWLGWAAFTLLGGSGVLAYLIAALIIPKERRLN